MPDGKETDVTKGTGAGFHAPGLGEAAPTDTERAAAADAAYWSTIESGGSVQQAQAAGYRALTLAGDGVPTVGGQVVAPWIEGKRAAVDADQMGAYLNRIAGAAAFQEGYGFSWTASWTLSGVNVGRSEGKALGQTKGEPIVYGVGAQPVSFEWLLNMIKTQGLTDYQVEKAFTVRTTSAATDPLTGTITPVISYTLPENWADAYRAEGYYKANNLPVPDYVYQAMASGTKPHGEPKAITGLMAPSGAVSAEGQARARGGAEETGNILREIYQAALPKVPEQKQYYRGQFSDIYTEFSRLQRGQVTGTQTPEQVKSSWRSFLEEYPWGERYVELPTEMRGTETRFAPRTRWLEF